MQDDQRHRAPLAAWALLLLLFAVVGPAIGCGNTSSAGGPGNGALRVEHSPASFGVVDRIVVREHFGFRTFEFDVTLLPGDSHTVTELLSGFYDVDIRWEGGHEDTYPNVFVSQNHTTELTVSR
jgi:hypothetical protein